MIPLAREWRYAAFMSDIQGKTGAAALRPVPRWFSRLAHLGLQLLRPFVPALWLQRLEQAAWFIAVGGLNTLISYLVFCLIINVTPFGRVVSLFLAYFLGGFVTYHNFGRLVFYGASLQAFKRSVPVYILLYGCNQALLELLFRLTHWPEELCQFLLLPVVAALSFVFNRVLVFRS